MTPTKDQQAQEYAEKKLQARRPNSIHPLEFNKRAHTFDYNDIQQAYLDGYTACEQSMWRSVEEELPEDLTNVLVHCSADTDPEISDCIAYYKHGIWYFMDVFNTGCNVSYWMPIPSLPDTNTENK